MKISILIPFTAVSLLVGNTAFAECKETYTASDVMSDLKKGNDAIEEINDSVIVSVGKDIERKI